MDIRKAEWGHAWPREGKERVLVAMGLGEAGRGGAGCPVRDSLPLISMLDASLVARSIE